MDWIIVFHTLSMFNNKKWAKRMCQIDHGKTIERLEWLLAVRHFLIDDLNEVLIKIVILIEPVTSVWGLYQRQVLAQRQGSSLYLGQS